jgi:hypothetical protein
VVLILLGLLGGSPDRLYETRFNLDLIDQGVAYALLGWRFARPVGAPPLARAEVKKL